jgi:invasion protein IalB
MKDPKGWDKFKMELAQFVFFWQCFGKPGKAEKEKARDWQVTCSKKAKELRRIV